jgi:hypothetical protein
MGRDAGFIGGAATLVSQEVNFCLILEVPFILAGENGFFAALQSSVTEVEEHSCPPKEFIGLRNGGRKSNYIVEGILFQSGRLLKRDQRWAVRKFRQR